MKPLEPTIAKNYTNHVLLVQNDPFQFSFQMGSQMFLSGNYGSALIPLESCLTFLLKNDPNVKGFPVGSRDYLITVTNMYLRSLRELGHLTLMKKHDSKVMEVSSQTSNHELMALWSCYLGILSAEYELTEPGYTARDAISNSERYLQAALQLFKSKVKPLCSSSHLQRAREIIQLPALKGLVFLYYKQGSYDQAERAALKAIQIATILLPTSTASVTPLMEPLCQYGAILVKQERVEEAKTIYEKAINLTQNPKDKIQICYGLSQVCILLKKFKEAINHLEDYIALHKVVHSQPSRLLARALLNVGVSYFQEHDLENAMKNVEEARTIAWELDAQDIVAQAESILKNFTKAQ
jgi:tetratricopeptide (TPR) repeat protein